MRWRWRPGSGLAMVQRNRATKDARAGGVFVEGGEKTGVRDFRFCGQRGSPVLRGRKRLPEECGRRPNRLRGRLPITRNNAAVRVARLPDGASQNGTAGLGLRSILRGARLSAIGTGSGARARKKRRHAPLPKSLLIGPEQ